MSARRTPIAVHLLGATLAGALAAYWGLRLAAPASPIAPAAASAVALQLPDARLAARLFGDVSSGPVANAVNVQVSGVFAAGREASAVIAVEGKPARAVLLGQEVVPGLRLVEVRPEGVTLERDGARSQYAVPPPTLAKSSLAVPMFRRDGNTLTAPSQEQAAAPATTGAARSAAGLAPQGNLVPPAPRHGMEEQLPGRAGMPPPASPAGAPANSPPG